MPVTQSLTQKVEILNTIEFQKVGQWETGAMTNVASVPTYEPTLADLNNPNYVPIALRKLELAKSGVDFKQYVYNKDAWTAFKHVSSTNVDTTYGDLRLAKNGEDITDELLEDNYSI